MSDVPFRLVSSNFTRPNDTTAYASGDLVANNTTAGSVTPLSWDVHRSPSGSFRVNRVKVKKSGAVVTNASFRLHLYSTAPTVANGDNGAWSSSEAGYLGFIDVVVDKAFTDGSAGHGAPVYTNVMQLSLKLPGTNDTTTSKKIYGLLEARGAYTPAAQEVFTVSPRNRAAVTE
jgi:hypothetical protein